MSSARKGTSNGRDCAASPAEALARERLPVGALVLDAALDAVSALLARPRHHLWRVHVRQEILGPIEHPNRPTLLEPQRDDQRDHEERAQHREGHNDKQADANAGPHVEPLFLDVLDDA
ncbi:hypothetical protein [Pseudoclavibacter helvolus]|uniref:hypothetical protein n=1 Tax=Pseudoclavibacter helvolus TaxID=255205 RepID=UPI001F15D2A6|nr:hypothetical protein [Pseudoclavibacter helvolus]